MKRAVFFLIIWLCLAGRLAAERHLAAIPVNELRAQLPASELNGAVRLLAGRGFGVLHYDASYVLAVTPANTDLAFGKQMYLADYPTEDKLYLVGKVAGSSGSGLQQAGKILLELDTEYLLASQLDDQALRDLIDQPFVLLGREPLRFTPKGAHMAWREESRILVSDMVAQVSADSVLARLQGLQDLQTRYALADNRLQVAEWIRQQFVNCGITDTQLQPFTWNGTTQYNVIATIPGTDYPDEYVIVGGHHDSRSNNTDSYVFAPGADDNASGTVAALEMARVMLQSGFQPKASIRFVTFAAEEFGLWGSKYYAQNALDTGQNIRLMINHDMIANQSSAGNWQVRLMPYDGSYVFSDFAVEVAEQFTALDVYYGTLNSAQSDSHPFWQRGFNVLYFFEAEFSPWYHSAQDIVANLNPNYCAEAIRASLACAAAFADHPAVPLAPENVQITLAGNSLSLSWNAVSQTTLGMPCTPLQYNVFACLSPDGAYSLAASTSNLSYTYLIPDPAPERLFFCVTAEQDSRDMNSSSLLQILPENSISRDKSIRSIRSLSP